MKHLPERLATLGTDTYIRLTVNDWTFHVFEREMDLCSLWKSSLFKSLDRLFSSFDANFIVPFPFILNLCSAHPFLPPNLKNPVVCSEIFIFFPFQNFDSASTTKSHSWQTLMMEARLSIPHHTTISVLDSIWVLVLLARLTFYCLLSSIRHKIHVTFRAIRTEQSGW